MALLNPAEATIEAYRYMRADDMLDCPVDLIFIFGNGSEQQYISEKVAQVYRQQHSLGNKTLIVCAGGIGRGSIRLDESEASLLRNQLVDDFRLPETDIYTETTSRNAGENCRNGMKLITDNHLPHHRLALVADTLAMRRMRAVFELEALLAGFDTHFFNCPTDKKPDLDNPLDRLELFSEVVKVADWPIHEPKWSQEQTPPPPHELLLYARAQLAAQVSGQERYKKSA